MKLRQLGVGVWFVLKRTGHLYRVVGPHKSINHAVVQRHGDDHESTLHRENHVIPRGAP